MYCVAVDDEGERLPDAFSLAKSARHSGNRVSGRPNASCSGIDDGLGGRGRNNAEKRGVGIGAQYALARAKVQRSSDVEQRMNGYLVNVPGCRDSAFRLRVGLGEGRNFGQKTVSL